LEEPGDVGMNRKMPIQKIVWISALMVIMLVAAWQPVSARDTGGAARAGANADAFAAMCRAAGGTPEFTTAIDPGGYVTYIVECKGGYLGGLNCIFDEGFTSCTQTRKLTHINLTPVEVVEVAPINDHVQPEVIETADVDATVVANEPNIDPTTIATAELTEEPTAIPTVAPTFDDGGVVIVDPVVLDEAELPELVSVPVVPVIEPGTPIEVITLP
jgi:hypothetical protein